jgi:hypothetical protein
VLLVFLYSVAAFQVKKTPPKNDQISFYLCVSDWCNIRCVAAHVINNFGGNYAIKRSSELLLAEHLVCLYFGDNLAETTSRNYLARCYMWYF